MIVHVRDTHPVLLFIPLLNMRLDALSYILEVDMTFCC